MYKLTSNAAFTASFTISSPIDGLTNIHVTAKALAEPSKLELRLNWQTPAIGVHAEWSPLNYRAKTVKPSWGGFESSNATTSAPVFANVAYDDTNKMTIACSDSKNAVRIRSGAIERVAMLQNDVIINVDCNITDYEADIRIDTREIPFYRAVADVAKWWETYDGYAPIFVPEEARSPIYSTWYSYLKNIDADAIVADCEYFAKLGCKAVIVDDGWQTSDYHTGGYDYCGDWEVTDSKGLDMKSFVDAVHSTGMKFILWYAVPFFGIHSKAYERFKDKMLANDVNHGNTYIIDPRYPEVREYLIGIYKKAVLDWGLDGFKLDFIDYFKQSSEVKPGMDYVSVYDAVDRLMKDVMTTLKALNPEILIEFRQKYIGPLMRSFGNMLRVSDCPNDSFSNRLGTLSLRLTSGETAVHSDMVQWHPDEPVELAAFQLTNILFSVPQISVRHDKIPESHRRMLEFYLGFWTKYRFALLDGELSLKNYAGDWSFVSAKADNTTVGVVYSGRIAAISEPTDEIVLVNASLEREIIIDAPALGRYDYTVVNCMGETVARGELDTVEAGLTRIAVPVNGAVMMRKI